MKNITEFIVKIEVAFLRRRVCKERREIVRARKQTAELMRLSRREIELRSKALRRKQLRIAVKTARFSKSEDVPKKQSGFAIFRKPVRPFVQGCFGFIA